MTVILTPLDLVVIFVHVFIPIVQHVFTFVPRGNCRFVCKNNFENIYIPHVVVVTVLLNMDLQCA